MSHLKEITPKRNDGFTLVEVLVGLLVIVGFISTAMQALVTATVFKVKGQELSEATTWIQEDLEMVKFKANRLHYVVDPDPAKSMYDPNEIACQGTTNTGYASVLNDALEPVTSSKTSAIGNRSYTLSRTITLPSSAPYNVLTLEYQVASADNVPIAITHTKVVPDVSLACP